MAESVVKSKMRSESLYVDSFSAFQLLRYNSFLAPTGKRPPEFLQYSGIWNACGYRGHSFK